MDYIVTHHNADLDALASMVAAGRLYAGATLVRGRAQTLAVRQYLALHGERFVLVGHAGIRPTKGDRIVVVDVRDRRRLQEYEGWWDVGADVHVFDHHPKTAHDLVASQSMVEPLGACATLLVEAMWASGLRLDPVEASLMMLGIYSDTGQLTFRSTTVRDMEACAGLMRSGARLDVVQRYLRAGVTAVQRALLAALMDSLEELDVHGNAVGVCALGLAGYVAGASDMLEQLMGMSDLDALVGILAFQDTGKVQVIGRSRSAHVPLDGLFAGLGGGGHALAGAALVRGKSAREVRSETLRGLYASARRPLVVGELMSAPVVSVGPQARLWEVREHMDRAGVGGLPVVSAQVVRGMLTRRDLGRVAAQGAWHLPAAAYMRHPVHVVSEAATAEQALRQMTQAHVGRLPVLRGEELVGIITRGDLMAYLYRGGRGGFAGPLPGPHAC